MLQPSASRHFAGRAARSRDRTTRVEVLAEYQLNFVEDRDLEDEAALRAILTDLGQSADDVLQRALAPENRERLKRQTARPQALGVFGAPTFVVGSELFWGQDRMRQALAWASRDKAQP